MDEVLELFIELGADDDQLDFPVVYASAINGTSSLSDDPADQKRLWHQSLIPLLTISQLSGILRWALQFQVSLLDYNDFVGRIGIGRVFRGTVKVGTKLPFLNLMAQPKTSVLQNSLVSLVWNVVKSRSQSWWFDCRIRYGRYLRWWNHYSNRCSRSLPILHIDEPTLQMTFLVQQLTICWSWR